MYKWKWISFSLCLATVPLHASAEPPDHAANKKPHPNALMARQVETKQPPMAAATDSVQGATNQGAEARPQPRAAAADARAPESDALRGAREGLRAGQGNLNVAAQRLEQSATLRERAEQARSRAWTRWKAKLLTEDAIDPKVQRELEQHARREAKLQRLGALAQQAGDTQALERLAKLQALEASLHDKHMQALTAKSDRSTKEPAQP